MRKRLYDIGQKMSFRPLTLALTLLFTTPIFAQKITRIDPPNWWRGLATDTVELLVYGEDLSKVKEVEIEGSGVSILGWKHSENQEYIYLTVHVASEGSADQKFDFGRGKKAKYAWSVLANPNHKPRGHSEADVMYLITPDRFANGDSKNDAFEEMNEKVVDRNEPFGRHGGDIQGIIDHLDYLKDLGITSVWSCPLLENDMKEASYHGYAITDHYAIDQRFGTNQLYKEYGDELHKRGMKLVMDAVYNHCGDQHPLFLNPPDKDWINWWEEGYTQTNYRAAAFLDPNVSQSDFKKFQDGWFVPTMPDLNQRNPHVARYLAQNTIWWITYAGIDAIRIDTYAYPDQPFMNSLMREVKRNYNDYLLFGEIWVTGHQVQGGWAEGNPLLKEKASALPQVLDFQFCFGVQEMVKKSPGWAEGTGRFYLTLAGDWMYEDPRGMITFVDNHDMGRIFGEVGGDMNKYNVAMGVLLTSRGIPCIYYGTEVLMKETANHGVIREDFDGGWPGDEVNKFTVEGRSEQENAAFNMTRKLNQFRQNNAELFSGEFVHFVPQDGVYVYFRKGGGKTLMCIVNASDKEVDVDTKRFKELAPDGKKFSGILNDSSLSGGESIKVAPISFDALISQ